MRKEICHVLHKITMSEITEGNLSERDHEINSYIKSAFSVEDNNNYVKKENIGYLLYTFIFDNILNQIKIIPQAFSVVKINRTYKPIETYLDELILTNSANYLNLTKALTLDRNALRTLYDYANIYNGIFTCYKDIVNINLGNLLFENSSSIFNAHSITVIDLDEPTNLQSILMQMN